MIRRVVITAAGIGTRLLTVTKEQPKEMLPLFAQNPNHLGLNLKPLLQIVFEQLYGCGFRDFCFIIGRGKRVIEDHFTIDLSFVKQLSDKGKYNLKLPLELFYKKLSDSLIVWINQPEPKGFGHAVLMAKPYVKEETFLVHAGDTYIFSTNNNKPVERLIKTHTENKSDATLLLKEIENPKKYGVAEIKETNGVIAVEKVTEKPENPQTNLAVMPVYVFNHTIIAALEKTPPGLGGEIQLTDAIQQLINEGFKVNAVKMRKNETRLDVGTPETYWHAITTSYKRSRPNK
ncbi:MAG: sugar phosphate nucleotidyltransferase [Candidatus Bathyarchaeota archaeon]|nr:sugar phosphate nucleotidyltransferase [Candidatus Bathyarchaeota archaeon]